MLPVFGTCVPPQSSTESPYLITRTSSPYFSPNNAMAPIALASAIGTLRCSSRAMALRTFLFASRSTASISSSVIFWKCEKSKRSSVGDTYEPFCSTCVPSTSLSASCNRWVAVWLHDVAKRLSVSIFAIIAA